MREGKRALLERGMLGQLVSESEREEGMAQAGRVTGGISTEPVGCPPSTTIAGLETAFRDRFRGTYLIG